MAKPEQLPAVTPFSRAFGAALREVMASRGVTQSAVAEAIGRNQGYISERLNGLRPVDTDMIAGIAEVGGTSPRAIVAAVLADLRIDPVAAQAERFSTAPLPTRGKRPPRAG